MPRARAAARRSTATDDAVPPLSRSIADPAVFTAAFDAFVAILVEAGKVLPHLLLPSVDDVAFSEAFET